MGVFGGPNKVKGGIVFSLDGANPASYAGDSPSPIGTDYGYFAGAYPALSTVDRVDYSSDTPTMTAKGPLSANTSHMGATSSTSY